MSETESTAPLNKSHNALKNIFSILGYGSLGLFIFSLFVVTISLSMTQSSSSGDYVGKIARAQQTYFLEKGTFTNFLDDLQVGLLPMFSNYTYSISVNSDKTGVIITAFPGEGSSRYYTSAVFMVEPSSGLTTTVTEICESFELLEATLPILNLETGEVDCPPGSTPLS